MSERNDMCWSKAVPGLPGVRFRRRVQRKTGSVLERYYVEMSCMKTNWFVGSYIDFFEACCARKSAENAKRNGTFF